MVGVWARILLRVAAGFLIAKGMPEIAEYADDPDFHVGAEALLGGAVWAATEGWYYLAKRMGWAT